VFWQVRVDSYLYNGMELQDELGLGLYDYGARFYDPVIGRFTTQDRFSEKYHYATPYHYTLNNPILFIDVNGDSLRTKGTANENLDFRILLKRAFDWKVDAYKDDNENWVMTQNEGTEFTDQEQLAFDYIQDVLKDELIIELDLISNEDPSDQNRLVKVDFDRLNTSEVDVDDVKTLDNSPNKITLRGFMVHLLKEQQFKAVQEAEGNNSSYRPAHAVATSLSNNVQNAQQDPFEHNGRIVRLTEGGKENTYIIQPEKDNRGQITRLKYIKQK
jgi:RHS repeat-associated protein